MEPFLNLLFLFFFFLRASQQIKWFDSGYKSKWASQVVLVEKTHLLVQET